MNARTEFSNVDVPIVDPAAMAPPPSYWTLLADAAVQAWYQCWEAMWAAEASHAASMPQPTAPANERILDLGVLDETSQVRSRGLGDTILLEVVSRDNTVLSRYTPGSDSIDTVRVAFDCSRDPMDFDSSQFDEGHLTYIQAETLVPPSEAPCAIVSLGSPIPPDAPVLPPQHAVI